MKPISIELYNPDILTEYTDNGVLFKVKQKITPVLDKDCWVFKDGKTIYFVSKKTNVVIDKWIME